MRNCEGWKTVTASSNYARTSRIAAVQRLFDYLFKRVKVPTSNLQIIVTEHANLNTPEYRRALVEEPWVNGKGLISADWLPT